MTHKKDLSAIDSIVLLAICCGLAAFLVWIQLNLMGDAAFTLALGYLNWGAIGFIAALTVASILNTVLSDKLPWHGRLLLAVLVPLGSFLACVFTMRVSLH
jgi:hypothetical protein